MERKMNPFFRLLLFVCGFAITLIACTNEDNGTPGTDGQNAKYTIMIYGCGGKNVDIQMDYAIADIAKALNVSNNQVRVTVMYSMSKDISAYKKLYPKITQDNFSGEFGKTYRYELTKDVDTTLAGFRSKYFYKNASEVSSPRWLTTSSGQSRRLLPRTTSSCQ